MTLNSLGSSSLIRAATGEATLPTRLTSIVGRLSATAAAGNASALEHVDANNFPPIPPRVGPSTLPRSIGITHLVDSEDDEEPNNNNSETSKAAGKKRAAPDGHGKAATGGKKPKTK
ncbi:hypothetical protein FPRO05_02380 [Fusarium proliferatum]|uniref:Uncharacterized protein n=1 Tax=Gibberella intermedia TaxID=948311 RepID=A0A365MYG8_GIBIN|nr:hypothetical protein FPRO05_02380 [Fusarium proliferatum]